MRWNCSYLHPVRASLWQAGLVAGGVGLVFAFISTEIRHPSAALHSREAQPRLAAARGQLLADEEGAIRAFNTVSFSVVFIQSGPFSRNLFQFRTMDIAADAGSGFVWDPNGYIVTTYHVVRSSKTVQVALGDQSVWKAQRVGVDPDKDIAVLKVDAPKELLPAIPIGTSGDLQVGQRVFAIGNPFGYDQTLTAGVVSGLGREIPGAAQRPIRGVIQTDAAMNPGNSGGPLLDSAGRVIGMNTAILSPTGAHAGIGFAIPIDTINRIVPEIIRGEPLPKPRLGVTTAEDHLVRRLGLRGVLILSILPNTTAEKAGLHGTQRNDLGKIVLGDLIVAIGGEPVRTNEGLFRVMDRRKVGEAVPFTILREGKKMDVEVTLESMP